MSSTSIQPKNESSPRTSQLTLELPPVVFAAVWVFFVLFHAVCGTFLICVAMTYWYLTKGVMPFYVSIWSLTGNQHYRFYGVVFGVVGGMHGLRVLNIIIMSIRARRLTLRSDGSSMIQNFVSKRVVSDHATTDTRPTFRFMGPFAFIWNNVFSRKGIFGVESEHFSTIFAFREVLVASSQTYQAYQASNLLPRPALNSLIVGMLITNCWSTAAIQLFLRKAPALERVVTLMYDALLSFGMMIMVPLIIFIPYVEEFNFENSIFKNPDFLYNPVPLATMVLENRLIFASGLFDFGTKLIPQLSIFLSLVTVSDLLGRVDVKVIPGAQSMQSVTVKPKASSADNLKTGDANKTPGSSENSNQWGSVRAFQKWKRVITIVVFVLWGELFYSCTA